MPTAKIFWSGNSQAVRLPKEFRIDADEVSIRRKGEQVILEPVRRQEWPAEFWQAFEGMPDGFERPEQIPKRRAELDP
jgi:antitoxin VapB